MKNYNDIDYMNDPNIDRRIKEICIQAEKNYIMTNYKPENEKNESNFENNNYQSNDFNTYNRVDTPKGSIHEKINDFNYYEKPFNSISINNNEFNNDVIQNNKQNTNIHNIININQDLHNLNQKYSNHQNNQNSIQNNHNFYQNNNQNSYQNNQYSYHNMNLSQKYQKENISDNNNNKSNSLKYILREKNSLNLSPEMINTINDSVQLKSTNNLNQITLSTSLSSINTNTLKNTPHLKINDFQKPILSSNDNCQCFECELRKLIQKNNLYHINLKQNTEINKSINNVILEGKYFLSKGKYEECYDILKSLIEKGLNHPDLFYLYGETCRKLKIMEDSEKYLILCMNFENCSPYVYYSLGLLYEECGQYKYSNYFLKKSLNFFNDSNIYFILSNNYFILNKNLKALKRINEAIDMNNSKIEYYKLRCDIYKKIGRSDLCKNDEMMIELINRKKNYN